MSGEFGTPKEHFTLFGISAAWIIAIVLLIGGVSAGIWALGVATSNIKGAGGAIKQRNSTVNRVQKQEMFEQLAADYDGYIVQIKVAEEAIKLAEPVDKSLRKTELLGLKQICISAAQQFNAESRKYTSRVWKSAGLPANLDPEGC